MDRIWRARPRDCRRSGLRGPARHHCLANIPYVRPGDRHCRERHAHTCGADGGACGRARDGRAAPAAVARAAAGRARGASGPAPRAPGRPRAAPARARARPAAQVTRVAALDLGTNTTRLLVADVAGGRVDEVVRRTTITRLGEGVDARRRLLPVPIARVRNVLSVYRREAESFGAERTLLIATSAVRDAENGEAFLGEIEWSYGFATQLLSGDDEAELTRRGLGRLAAGTLLVDIGGGSTELVLDDFQVSLP